MKVWDRARMELATPGIVFGLVTDFATSPRSVTVAFPVHTHLFFVVTRQNSRENEIYWVFNQSSFSS